MAQWEGRAAIYDVVVDNLQAAEEEAQQPARRFYKHEDPFLLEEQKFKKMFRLSKQLARDLIGMLTDYLRQPTRASAISVELKVLVTLRFYATGSYQEIVGSCIFSAISQPSTSRCIQEVTDALNTHNILNAWITFPSTINEMETLRTRFYNKHQLPGVIGVIDCTHVAIVMPSGNEYPENIYVNRKNYHSINVQLGTQVTPSALGS
ncbi:unnamed protein product [Callosobruchus maculatus]|uniref:Nuclease HARBI1 n=1 Tax=Callosobruchus maculatus TaxID=64391 RepID=A0A653BU67_CALMS|nr:unnamed protein product [Callosobruchus maculatus]